MKQRKDTVSKNSWKEKDSKEAESAITVRADQRQPNETFRGFGYKFRSDLDMPIPNILNIEHPGLIDIWDGKLASWSVAAN